MFLLGKRVKRFICRLTVASQTTRQALAALEFERVTALLLFGVSAAHSQDRHCPISVVQAKPAAYFSSVRSTPARDE